jgi:hypothetical protein
MSVPFPLGHASSPCQREIDDTENLDHSIFGINESVLICTMRNEETHVDRDQRD